MIYATFSNFSRRFLNPNYLFQIWIIRNCLNLLDLKNLQEQFKKAFCYKKLFWPFTVWINCSSFLKIFANSRPTASNFKSFSRSLEQFFIIACQNSFSNKIPLLTYRVCFRHFSAEQFKTSGKYLTLKKGRLFLFLSMAVEFKVQW